MVIALYVALDYIILDLVISPNFEAFGKREAVKDLKRCEEAILSEQKHLDTLCLNWANCNDVNAYVAGRAEGEAASGLVPPPFNRDELNAVYICDLDGNVLWGELREFDTGEPIELVEFPPGSFPEDHPLIDHEGDESIISGIMMTANGPMMVSSRPILASERDGPMTGTLIIGRFLDEDVIETIAKRTRVDFKLLPIKDGSGNREGRPSGASKVIRDIEGEDAFTLWVEVPWEIITRGKNVITFARISVLAVALLVLAVLLILIQRIVISPITELTEHLVEIGKSNDLSNKLAMKRDDEIGTLAGEFDGMIQQLDTARKKLMDQSYSAGKSEMVSLMLHNIRNILSPIICEIDTMRQKLTKAPIEQMKRAERELNEGNASPERERDLKEFLDLGIEDISNLADEMISKMSDVLDRTNEIVGLLDDYSKSGNAEKPAEMVELDDVLSESIRLMPKDLHELVSVEIGPEIDELEPLEVHRTTCREIFTELLINAAEAIRRANVEGGRIDIHADREDADGVPVVHVRICDNGEGIEPDKIEKIFTRGVSSKKDGHRGAGLHWCANTIAAMNGSIKAESKGSGQGACMHIIFPQVPGPSISEEEE